MPVNAHIGAASRVRPKSPKKAIISDQLTDVEAEPIELEVFWDRVWVGLLG